MSSKQKSTQDIHPEVAPCGTHHIDSCGKPLYAVRFDEVLAFHQVGDDFYAPVIRNGRAWHIDKDGKPAYEGDFLRTFGFYCQHAAVVSSDGWFHIRQDGSALYTERYAFAGNFQQDTAVVCDKDGCYYHIDIQGRPLYSSRWMYCGDFRDGYAVVQARDGRSTHIDRNGGALHGQWFYDLDVFHKGFARAKDTRGWCHIDLEGNPIYPQRYNSVEPFYNGFSRCECDNGSLLVIDEQGKIVRQLRAPTSDTFAELSADMVGYWRTFTIATAVQLGVFEGLPSTLRRLADYTQCEPDRLDRLLRALEELSLVVCPGSTWHISDKGMYLRQSDEKSLAYAALEYASGLHEPWKHLAKVMQGNRKATNIFAEVAADPERVSGHHQMLRSYALHDYEGLVSWLPIQPGDTVFDAAGGSGMMAQLIEREFPDARVVLGDLLEVINLSGCPHRVVLDLFGPWPIKADKIILSRVLHDWSDDKVRTIFEQASNALAPGGSICVVEMLLDEEGAAGALCDLHLLAVTGGKERTLKELELLAAHASLELSGTIDTQSLVSVICFERKQR